MINLENIYFKYRNEDKYTIDNVSFNVEEGDFVSIIGPNGSGKSTLIKLINKLEIPNSGNIQVDNKNITKYKRKDLAKKIALVPQELNINYNFSVKDIVSMGRNPYKNRFESKNEKDRKTIEESLIVTNTYYLKNRKITELSGGEKQRVMIARAIAQTPDIILLDEPTSNLDINHQIEILQLLSSLNKTKSITIVLVIHDINLAIRYSEKIIILNKGKIVDMGKPKEVITKTNIENVFNIRVGIETNSFLNKLSITPIEISTNNSDKKEVDI